MKAGFLMFFSHNDGCFSLVWVREVPSMFIYLPFKTDAKSNKVVNNTCSNSGNYPG